MNELYSKSVVGLSFADSCLNMDDFMQVLIFESCPSAVIEQIADNDNVLNHLSIPAACFTHPEISMVGLTEVRFLVLFLMCI